MVDLILPVLDEAGSLPWVLERVPDFARALVVDNGSTDGSGDIARGYGATVVEEPVAGFGSACWAGLSAARAPVVCFMDADGSIDPKDLWRVVDPVTDGRARLALGRRIPAPGAMAPHVRWGNAIVAWRVRRSTGVTLRDLGPLRAAHREDLLGLGIEDRRFGWPLEMVVKAAAAGWTVLEVDVPYGPRRSGSSKVTGTVRGTMRTVRDMAAYLR